MKRIGIQLFCALLCMTLLAACGQTPPVPDESVPQDVSTTTTTTTTEETTTTSTEEITTTTAAKPTAAKPTTTTTKPTATTTTKTTPTTTITTTTVTMTPTTTTTTTATTVITTTTATTVDPKAPPTNRQRMSLRFAGRVCTLEYYETTWDKDSGQKQWRYRETNPTAPHPISCTVDAETGRIVYVYQSIKRSVSIVMEEKEFRDCFKQKYTESNLGPLYLYEYSYEVDYKINAHSYGAETGTVTITLNDAGDKVEWTIVKVDKVYLGSVKVVLADPNVYPDELANFYVPTYIG